MKKRMIRNVNTLFLEADLDMKKRNAKTEETMKESSVYLFKCLWILKDYCGRFLPPS